MGGAIGACCKEEGKSDVCDSHAVSDEARSALNDGEIISSTGRETRFNTGDSETMKMKAETSQGTDALKFRRRAVKKRTVQTPLHLQARTSRAYTKTSGKGDMPFRGNTLEQMSNWNGGLDKASYEKTPEDVELIQTALSASEELLHILEAEGMSIDEFMELAHKQTFDPGERIVSDRGGDSLCILAKGLLKAIPENAEEDIVERIIHPGNCCGEASLLPGSIMDIFVAQEASVVWTIDIDMYTEKKLHNREMKNETNVETLNKLTIFEFCSEFEKKTIANALVEAQFDKGDMMYKRGDDATHLYILLDGVVDQFLDDELVTKFEASKEEGTVACFGDRALLASEPRRNTAIVSSATALIWEIDRDEFTSALGPMQEIRARQKRTVTHPAVVHYLKFIEGLAIFSNLTAIQKESTAKVLDLVKFRKGEIIYKAGDDADTFYVLLDGELDVRMDKGHLKQIRADSGSNVIQYFGERALTTSAPRQWTVKVVSDSAKALKMSREAFKEIVGSNAVLEENNGQRRTMKQVPRASLEQLELIGASAYGPQHLCLHRAVGKTYVLSTMGKGLVCQGHMQSNLQRHKELWMQVDNPFLLKLYATYNEPSSIFFLSEFAQAGTLSSVYEHEGFYGNVQYSKYYVASITCALAYLHSMRIIHRDVKPDNVFITAYGEAKLGGLAVAKRVNGKTYSTCGTPEYMAPETLVGTAYNKAVDYWALGVVTFELLAGLPPFVADSPLDVYGKVMKGMKKVEFPEACSGKAGALIKDLCKHEPGHRLGMRSTKAIKDHAWFTGFAWSKLEQVAMQPPYKPKVTSPTDASHYHVDPSDVPEMVKYVEDGTDWETAFTEPAAS